MSPVQKVTRQYRCRVRQCRLRALIATQHELARKTGIHPHVINALENGRLFLSSPYALLIAEVLRCPLGDLFEKRSK